MNSKNSVSPLPQPKGRGLQATNLINRIIHKHINHLCNEQIEDKATKQTITMYDIDCVDQIAEEAYRAGQKSRRLPLRPKVRSSRRVS